AKIDPPILSKLCGLRRQIAEDEPDELLTTAVLQRRIESSLESDRRAWLPAQSLAARRAAEVRRVDLKMIRQRQQPAVQAVVQGLGQPALRAASEEVRSTDAAGKQRVAREDEPWLGGTRAVGHQQRHPVGRVPGR